MLIRQVVAFRIELFLLRILAFIEPKSIDLSSKHTLERKSSIHTIPVDEHIDFSCIGTLVCI
jgi:hypothetical protein